MKWIMYDRKRSNEKPPKNEVFRGFYILSALRLTLRDHPSTKAQESGIRNQEFGIRLTLRDRTSTKAQESGIRNSESGIRNPKSNKRSEEKRRDERYTEENEHEVL